ncbi:hypothetical protein [Methylotuvimicrobium alcaliphilum]|uniref:hypothetical protein n=1 Tax=Methylotuvimicrobium alcaliphilum TaxID=271065 RepID=UPI0005FB6101|nr:hypothetical protein [Methylotuvimicrobium alcaliphilum]
MQILLEQKSANAMDGVNADFAGAKICPAADTCQSSNRTCLLRIKNVEVIYDRILSNQCSAPNSKLMLNSYPKNYETLGF